MRTAFNLVAILLVGLMFGLVGRGLFRDVQPTGPSPEDVVHTSDLKPGEDPGEEGSKASNDEVARPPEDEAWLSRFELTERSGDTVSSEDLKGQPYVVSFFFTTCPSVCPQQNARLKELQEEFKGEEVRFLSISVDPETDTPEVLREYAARFGADPQQWLFLTGDLDYIRRIAAEIFQQPADKKFHTERFVLVDRDGSIEGLYSWPEEVQLGKLRESITEMLSS